MLNISLIARSKFLLISKRFIRSSKHTEQNGGLWANYCLQLEKRPFLTKSITSGILCLLADVVCQSNEQFVLDKKKSFLQYEFDYLRILRFGALGSLLVGPTLHVWYKFLGNFIPGQQLSSALKRLAVDQLIFGPLFLPTFFAANLLLENRPKDIIPKLQKEWFGAVIANWFLWVPAQFINFKVIPPHLQVLFSNSVGFIWNIYLSSIANNTISAPIETKFTEREL